MDTKPHSETNQEAVSGSPSPPCSPSLFRAGDTVKHRPTGEEWILAYDQERSDVSACGWPESIARAEDCELIKAADDGSRLDMLKTWAGNIQSDHRTRAARRQLSLENARFNGATGCDPDPNLEADSASPSDPC